MIVVIGAGPVGIYTAGLLIKAGHKVKMLEAGSWDSESSLLNHNSYNFETESAMPKNVHRVGGGSNYWHARFGEFLEEDFLALASSSIDSWAFPKDQLSDHYRRVISEISDTDLSDEEFLDTHLPHLQKVLNTDLDLRLFRYANGYSFNEKLTQLLKVENFELLTNCRVDSISAESQPSKSRFVCHVTTESDLDEVAADQILICAGTLQSTRLLLNSPRLNGSQRFQVIGKGLMEHLEGHVGVIKVPASHLDLAKKFSLSHGNRLTNLNAGVGIRLDSSTQTSLQLPSLHLELRPRPRVIRVQKHFRYTKVFNPVHYVERLCKLFLHYLEEGVDSLQKGKSFGLYVKSEELRNLESEIRIEASVNGDKLVYNHKVSQQSYVKFHETLDTLVPRVSRLFNAEIRLYDWVEKRHRNQKIETNWHPMGTLPMGRDLASSVCDPTLQVHLNEGLFIVSAAVFTRGSNGNPTFTTLALASKLVKDKFEKPGTETNG